MPENLLLALLDVAETWATRAGTTLAKRHLWGPSFAQPQAGAVGGFLFI